MMPDQPGRPKELMPGFRWTCAVCGASRVTTFAEEEEVSVTLDRAERALSSHIFSSIGDGHGPRDALPDNMTVESLADHIEPVTE